MTLEERPPGLRAVLLGQWLPPLSLFLLTVVLWEALVRLLRLPRYILPAPSQIGLVISEDWLRLIRQVGWTMLEAVGGFLLGSTLAFLSGVTFVHTRLIERAMYPWAIILQTVPIIAIAPLLTIWLGFGLAPKIVVAAIVCFFPVLVNTARGLRAITSEALELMHILSASQWQILYRLRLPASVPFVFAALRVAATLSVIGAIVGEFTGADRGIGYVVVSAAYRLDTPLLFAGITFSCLAAVAFFQLVSGVERLLLYWPGARLDRE